MIWVELVVVLAMIVVGARLGGLGLGMMGGMGVALLAFLFGDRPASPPIEVMLMIAAVITAAGALQAAGGMDYLVDLAERALRRHPPAITFVAPLVAYAFTLFAGTGHVAYAILPVISEVSLEAGVRPERPLSISVIASQQAITASPISAATVALVGLLSAGSAITLGGLMAVCIPATIAGVLVGALVASRMGKELKDDPEYRRRLAAGELKVHKGQARPAATVQAKLSVVLFLVAAVAIVFFGSFPALRPTYALGGKTVQMGMADAIEMVMLTAAALMALLCKASVEEVAKGSVFRAGMQAVIAIFGIAWMGDTFFQANAAAIQGPLEGMVQRAPWIFVLALFAMSILLYSQAATVRTLMPVGLSIGLPGSQLVGAFPAVNGYFFIPNYPTVVAAMNFDRTGTTRIGKYLLNHSFMLPGLSATFVAVLVGLVLQRLILQ
ncbi:MAG TPA: anaerobic C4-dicarboxylate transporter [Anaeromyxobacteraceae bacterium]|nr:anaerobic C4-dicarboxylate transporter [Anaeromyxobacteraceae bacterium]